jgi:hypothetical protein
MVLDQGIDTSPAVGRMFFQILGAIAEYVRARPDVRTYSATASPPPAHAAAAATRNANSPPRQAKIAQAMYDETRC